MIRLLKNVEFDAYEKTGVSEPTLYQWSPFWRMDINEPEDIVEEIGRLYGYDKLPRELPQRTAKPAKLNGNRELAKKIRAVLSRAGANEVLTYSFVHERTIKAAGQDKDDAYQLSNALSPDLQYYRLSVTPSLLDKVHANSKSGYDEFALFEIGKSHSKAVGVNDEGLPVELGAVAFVYTSKDSKEGAAFYQAKAFLEFLSRQLGVDLMYEPLSGDSTAPVVAPFEPKRSAIVSDRHTGRYIGVLGEYKKSVQRSFKLPEYTAGFELDTEALLNIASGASVNYRPLSRFPSVDRDISLKTEAALPYADIIAALEDSLVLTTIDVTVTPIGIYQPDKAATKNSTFRLTLTSHEKTLTSEEVNQIIDGVVRRLKSAINAEIV